MNNKKFGAASSSVDPSQFSLTIASALKLVATGAMYLGLIHGIDATTLDAQVQSLTDSLLTVATSAIAIYQAGDFIVGLVRKWFSNPSITLTQASQ